MASSDLQDEETRAAIRAARLAQNVSVVKGNVHVLCPWKRWIYDKDNTIARIHGNGHHRKPSYRTDAYRPSRSSVLHQDLTEFLKPREVISRRLKDEGQAKPADKSTGCSQQPVKDPIIEAMAALQAVDGWQSDGKRSRARTRSRVQQSSSLDTEQAATTANIAASSQQPMEDPIVPAISALQAADGWQNHGKRSRTRTRPPHEQPADSDAWKVQTPDARDDHSGRQAETPITPAMSALEAMDGWQINRRRSRRSPPQPPANSDPGQVVTIDQSSHNCERHEETPVIQFVESAQPQPAQPPIVKNLLAEPLPERTNDPIIEAIAALQAADGWQRPGKRSRLRTRSSREQSISPDPAQVPKTEEWGKISERHVETSMDQALRPAQPQIAQDPPAAESDPEPVTLIDESRASSPRQAETPTVQVAESTEPPTLQHPSATNSDPRQSATMEERIDNCKTQAETPIIELIEPAQPQDVPGQLMATDENIGDSQGQAETSMIDLAELNQPPTAPDPPSQASPAEPPCAQPPETTIFNEEPNATGSHPAIAMVNDEPIATGSQSFTRYCLFRIGTVLGSASKVANAAVDLIR